MNGNQTTTTIRPQTRLVLLALFSILALIVDSLPALLSIHMVAVCVFIATRPRWRSVALLIGMSLATIWGFALTQGIFYPFRPRTVLFQLVPAGAPVIGSLTGGVSLYAEGLQHGLVQSIRFMAMLTAGLTLVMTTSAQQLLAGLRAAHVPYAAAFMTATAVRFIPAVARETRSVLDAMRMRGMQLRPSRPWRYLPALARALPAIVTRNLRRAGTLADAVESKGFALRSDRAHERCEKATRLEHWLLAGAVSIVSLLAGLKLFLIVTLRSGWNDPLTGWIHEIARRYL